MPEKPVSSRHARKPPSSSVPNTHGVPVDFIKRQSQMALDVAPRRQRTELSMLTDVSLRADSYIHENEVLTFRLIGAPPLLDVRFIRLNLPPAGPCPSGLSHHSDSFQRSDFDLFLF